jgi:LmbE family N-acetylglucosaminyl deacetylase
MEVRAAAAVLGIETIRFLDLLDGEMDRADPIAVAARIAAHIREIRPQVVLTFDPRGAYGHPDHIAVSQFALSAVTLAAGPSTDSIAGEPFGVSKFYYRVWNREENEAYSRVFGDMAFNVDGEVRRSAPWEEWAITARIDTFEQWRMVWEAVRKHASQVGSIEKLAETPDAVKEKIFGCEGYYRAFSTVNGGREREEDLFEGLRE